MNPNQGSIRCSVIHNENLFILLQRTDVVIGSTSDQENHNLSFIRWIDPVESLLGKDHSINVDAGFEFESLLRSPRWRQCPFESLEPLRIERKILFHPSLQVLIGFPPGDRFIIG